MAPMSKEHQLWVWMTVAILVSAVTGFLTMYLQNRWGDLRHLNP